MRDKNLRGLFGMVLHVYCCLFKKVFCSLQFKEFIFRFWRKGICIGNRINGSAFCDLWPRVMF